MPHAIEPPIFDVLTADAEKTKPKAIENAAVTSYWWNTSGHDLAKMLEQASYPTEVQHQFLSYYKNVLCPLLGNPPGKDSARASTAWDGNPLSYSFELKGSSRSQSVRFTADLTELRPAPTDNPLGTGNTDKMCEGLSKQTPGFDDRWVKSLRKSMVYDHLSPSEQADLITKAGQQSSVIVGFDIHRRLTDPNQLPVLAKIYYLPGYPAAYKNVTRWQACLDALQALPDIDKYPNILKSANTITEFLSDKPAAWQMGIRWLATDLVAPENARFKVYMRCFGTTFDDIWDCYTLGGRIPNLDDDKEKFGDLMDMVSGTTYAETRSKDEMGMDRFLHQSKKLTTCYFSLSADNPTPAPKLCVYPSNFAPNDGVIARGLDQWLIKYEWNAEGETSMEEKVKSVLYV